MSANTKRVFLKISIIDIMVGISHLPDKVETVQHMQRLHEADVAATVLLGPSDGVFRIFPQCLNVVLGDTNGTDYSHHQSMILECFQDLSLLVLNISQASSTALLGGSRLGGSLYLLLCRSDPSNCSVW